MPAVDNFVSVVLGVLVCGTKAATLQASKSMLADDLAWTAAECAGL